MNNYVREFGLEDYKAMIGEDEEELLRQVLEDHDEDYDDLDYEEDEDDEEEYDPRTGNMMDDLGLSWRDFL